jgi:hypothetical protein
MLVELGAALVGRGPHVVLVGAFLACMFAPAGLRYGDRTLDAIKWIGQADSDKA